MRLVFSVSNRLSSMPVRTQVVTLPRLGYIHSTDLSTSDCWRPACLFINFDCWGRSGTTSGAIHTAMPRTIVTLVSMYILKASSHRYKDGFVGIFPFPLVF